MMSDHKTAVWVKTSLIGKALGHHDKKSPSSKVQKQAEWPWIRAVVLSGDVASGSSVNLLISEEGSEYHQEKVEIPASLPNKASGLVMANEWAENIEGTLPPDDLISLTHLHEPSVVYCLKKRYDQDIIYTATGPILIALNPFKDIPKLYDDDTMGSYWKKGEKVDDSLELPPHVYGTADRAFRSMMRALYMSHDAEDESILSVLKNQSILVSGESGAGKTVSTKHIMKYLATLSQRKAEHTKRRRAPSPGRGEAKRIVAPPSREPRRLSRRISRTQSWKKGALIEEKILQSNPILEAFANARTIRNDNSSRFGKFIELQFKQTGSLIGACIDTYLLEKVRLIHVGPGERTFHCFYELLAAATEDERRMFMLGNYTAQDFKMTSASGTYTRRDGVDDSRLFQKLVEGEYRIVQQ
jgi:myosin-5